MKTIWYELMRMAYNQFIPWEERHVRITLGENKIDTVYYLFNEEEKIKNFKYDEDNFMSNIQIKKSWDDITIGESILMGFCGKLEILKSDNREEFKIEFLYGGLF